MGDFNAQVGNRREDEEHVLGPHAWGKEQETEKNLLILPMNTV